MTAPYIYIPEDDISTPYFAPVYNPFYATPQGGPAPFLPPSHIVYPSSPYFGHSDGIHTGDAFNHNNVLWPDDGPQYAARYVASWMQPPNPWNTPPPWLANPNVCLPAFRPPPPPALQLIHPWLNGDAPSPEFHFDLAPAAFLPLRCVPTHPPSSALVTESELRAPAFHPPRFLLRITHPRLPFWPVDLPRARNARTPPLTLGDVLGALHRALHKRITPADWATLGAGEQAHVTRAFVARCRAEAVRSGAPPALLHDREVAVRNQGVKRIDFLLEKTVFKGLVHVPWDSDGCVRMVTA
ncbi:hypothetical protein B0H19DRAFT_1234339 [Mycena capillaripes]|nr:hypothetical protein B0H19DRAFT_1234339 [Mycena capillaripes]